MDPLELYKLVLFFLAFSHIFQVGCDSQETVITTCPDTYDSGKPANITIVSNGLQFTALAVCSEGEEHTMEVMGPDVKYIPVYFQTDPLFPSGDACVFMEDSAKPGYYYIELKMYYFITIGTKTVNCAYSLTSGSGAAVSAVSQNETIFKGPRAQSDITLEVTDIDGNVIPQGFETGRYIRLRGRITQLLGNETGLQAMNCIAGSLGTFQVITLLEGGCGNGRFIRKGKGFVSTGLQTLSAPFKSFSMISSDEIYFNCTFTICTGNASCIGSSCSTNGTVVTSLRKRRSMDIPFNSIRDPSHRQLYRMGIMGYGASNGHLFLPRPSDNKSRRPPSNRKRDKLIGLAITLSIISIVLTMALIIYLCFRVNDSVEF